MNANLKVEIVNLILYFTALGICFFCAYQTIRCNIISNEPNLFGLMTIMAFLALLVSMKYEAAFFLIVPILSFGFIVIVDFTEITKEQYEKISKIDKNIIINTIGNKTYINSWDYRNILEEDNNFAKIKLIEKDEAEKNDIRNKIIKKVD